jgi:hypothetical protein
VSPFVATTSNTPLSIVSSETYPRSETVRKIIIYLEALPSAPLSFSTLCHFAPALDPLPVSDNLELVF